MRAYGIYLVLIIAGTSFPSGGAHASNSVTARQGNLPPQPKVLTMKNAHKVRRAIYEENLRIASHIKGPLAGQREVEIPEEIQSAYKLFGVEVLKTLLAVVEIGRPDDAKKAAAYAFALAGQRGMALLAALTPQERVDAPMVPSQESLRDRWIENIRTTLNEKGNKNQE